MRIWVLWVFISGLVIAGPRLIDHFDRLSPEDVARAGNKLVMYTTTHCPYCAEARAWLRKNKVAYNECNIETQEACHTQWQRLGAHAVPTLVFEDRMQMGWDPAWLRSVLKQEE